VKAAMKSLTPEVRSALRLRSSARDDTRWVLRLAVKSGWQEANRRYLEAMREQGVEEMSALMKDLGVEGSLSDDEALDVLEAAVAVYLPEAEVERSASERGLSALTIRVRDCPTYARIERSGWHGVTACGSWHRRKGWYQALGIYPADTVVGEKKWGDEACVALVELPRPTRRGPTLIQPPNARQQGG